MEVLPEGLIDTWIAYMGPARAELLGPLRPLLIARPALPAGHEVMVAPALRLMNAVGRGRVLLDKDQEIRRKLAPGLNGEMQFISPSPLEAGPDAVLEVDMLLTLLRGCEMTDPCGNREMLTHLGRAYIDDHMALSYMLAAAVGMNRPNSIFGDIFEITLGWLLLDELEAGAIWPPVKEAAEIRDHKPHVEFEKVLELGIFFTYTHLRALNMFVPKALDDENRPRLTDVGRAGVIEALRASAATSFCSEHAFEDQSTD